MADPVIHAIVTHYEGFGLGVTSPQLPELVGGFDETPSDMDEALTPFLDAAGAPEEYVLQVHEQRVFEREERTWFVRVQVDRLPSRSEKRVEVANTLLRLLEVTPQPIDEARADATGDPVFLVCLPEDTIGWIEDQFEDDDWCTVVVDVGDDALSIFPLTRVAEMPAGAARLPRDMTLDELVMGLPFEWIPGPEADSAGSHMRESPEPVLV